MISNDKKYNVKTNKSVLVCKNIFSLPMYWNDQCWTFALN